MSNGVNPFVRAYETTKGRGLAGVIENITFDWLDFPWETDYGARAPKGVKINFGFKVIHDITPGLDHSGYNKAPLYNVGNIMQNISDDPHKDHGRVGKERFVSQGGVKAKGDKGGKN